MRRSDAACQSTANDASNGVQEFFAPIAAAKADSWEGTGLEGGGEAMSAVLDLIRQHKVSIVQRDLQVLTQY